MIDCETVIGMILCGGLGKRLRPVTESVPKALFELKDGYTILDRQILQYKGAGIDRVILLTAHLGERIEERFGDEHLGVRLEYVREKKPLGTLNAIRLGMKHARADAVVSNGDVVCDINLKRMCRQWIRSGALASMFVVRMRSPYGIVRFRGKHIVGFEEKPLLSYCINGGFYCLSRRLLPLLERYKTGDIERTAFPELARRGELVRYREEGIFWMSIDTLKDLEAAQREYRGRTDHEWGYEKTYDRIGKEIYVMAGYRTRSYRAGDGGETIRVLSGRGWFIPGEGRRKRLLPGSSVRVKARTEYRILATANLLVRRYPARE
jgi:NDP-sugar pyrophosphorylase family protein